MSLVFSKLVGGLKKFWTWLKANPRVLLVLIGFLIGVLVASLWYHRHPQVKVENKEVKVTDTATQDQLKLEIARNLALTQDLAITQNQLIDLQTKKTVHTHTEKKADGTVITDTTTETDTNKKTDTQTKTDEKTAVTDNTKIDESALHNQTTHETDTKTQTITPVGNGPLSFGFDIGYALVTGPSFKATPYLQSDVAYRFLSFLGIGLEGRAFILDFTSDPTHPIVGVGAGLRFNP